MKKLISKIFAFFAKHFDSMRSSESVSISDSTTRVQNVVNVPSKSNVGSNESPQEFPDSDLLRNVFNAEADEISENGSDAGASIQAAEGDAGEGSLGPDGNPLVLEETGEATESKQCPYRKNC